MTPSVVFRADAAPAMGGGHVQRCLALAEALAEAGWCTAFAFRAGTRETVPALAASPHRLLALEGAEDDEAALVASKIGARCDLLVVDHYGRGAAFETAGRRFAARIMVMEDRPGRRHDCDLLLDPTPGRKPAAYRDLVPAGCRLLLGTSYALLRAQFAKARAAALARSRRASPTRIFVSMGMTDPSNLTAAVLRGIAASGTGIAVDVLIGSVAPNLAALRRLIGELKLDARLHLDAENVAELMGAADLAVGAAGSSSFEPAASACPAWWWSPPTISAISRPAWARRQKCSGSPIWPAPWRPASSGYAPIPRPVLRWVRRVRGCVTAAAPPGSPASC